MKANRFWWHEQNKSLKQDCRSTPNCWLPRGHQGPCQPVNSDSHQAPSYERGDYVKVEFPDETPASANGCGSASPVATSRRSLCSESSTTNPSTTTKAKLHWGLSWRSATPRFGSTGSQLSSRRNNDHPFAASRSSYQFRYDSRRKRRFARSASQSWVNRFTLQRQLQPWVNRLAL